MKSIGYFDVETCGERRGVLREGAICPRGEREFYLTPHVMRMWEVWPISPSYITDKERTIYPEEEGLPAIAAGRLYSSRGGAWGWALPTTAVMPAQAEPGDRVVWTGAPYCPYLWVAANRIEVYPLPRMGGDDAWEIAEKEGVIVIRRPQGALVIRPVGHTHGWPLWRVDWQTPCHRCAAEEEERGFSSSSAEEAEEVLRKINEGLLGDLGLS